ncbi:insecticyanin-A-like [Achroia grisella]|uniref:insecticyanin-A-like n=1 Tax=Achroia grisella TaxID=688607 RepID=UPI0027D206C6|nr:insecticyanin-A-like [Achroia grisella]
MFKTIYLFITIVLNSMLSFSQVINFGKCPQVETMQYFDLERFQGLWYEIERFPPWGEIRGECAHKRIQACGRKVEIENDFVKYGIQFTFRVNSTYAPGDEAVFVIEKSYVDPSSIPISVITTDYENYAVIYGCEYNEEWNLMFILGWVLSKTPTLSPELTEEARNQLISIPFANAAYLEKVHHGQKDCAHLWVAHIENAAIIDTDEADND